MLEQVADHVGHDDAARRSVSPSRGWPGPLTLIIPASPLLCEDVHLSTGKVAVRVPADRWRARWPRRAGHAITSTSANISGRTASVNAGSRSSRSLGERIDVLIDAGATPGGLPSTIVDATGECSGARASRRDRVGPRARISR